MLHDALERRLAHLLDRLQSEEPAVLDAAPPLAELVGFLEKQIDVSIEKLVVEPTMRAAVRERPHLATSWPLGLSAAAPASEADRILRRLGQLESSALQSDERTLVTEALALLATIEHQVLEDRRRVAMAIDAGHPHHSLVSGMRDLPKDGMRHRGAKASVPVECGYIQVLAPNGGSVQLHFPIEGLNESILDTLREWRGPKGLRHWAALQRLLSVEGGRTGRVTWRLEEHLEAVGYAERTCRDPKVRTDVAEEVELLTRMELAVYDSDGKLRLRQALLTPLTKAERKVEGSDAWALEGLDLAVHPLLYSGVRDPKTGQIGTHWYPQTTELAKLDDVRFPYAITLGLLLPIRWRWAWAEGRDHCALSGGKLLSAAGIPYQERRSERAWIALRKTLAELARIEALGRYEWGREPETLNGLCRLYPPAWAVDRTLHALPAIETLHPQLPTTGRELREWRKGQGWTQAQLANELHVGLATIKRSEAAEAAPLGPAISKGWDKMQHKRLL